MLPSNLAGSYRRYKEDTNVFATWLLNTAETCGYNLGYVDETPKPQLAQPSTRLKGKARKEAKKAAANSATIEQTNLRYISTKEMLLQAEIIAKHKRPPVEMPKNIRNTLERAIRARTRCANWFRNTETDQHTDKSNRTHAYFISILEKALDTLEPCTRKEKDAGSSSDSQIRGSNTAHSTNIYGMLEVEDVGAETPNVTVDDIITASKPNAKRHLNICEMEIEDKIDLEFVVFCFFEDLQRIQEFLKETWKLVMKEELDAITASLVSNLAFSLARQIEDELTSSYPEFFGVIPSYVKIAGILHEVNFAKDKLDQQDNKSKRSTSDEFVYYSIFRILSKYLQYGHTQSDGAQCVIPISTLLSANALVYEQTGRHIMPATASAIDDWENEDRLLSQILLDVTNKTFLKYHHEIHFSEEVKEQRRIAERIISSPFEDEFTKGLMSTNKTGNIRVSIVFGARALMDISKILGDGAGKSYESLRLKASIASKALGIRFDASTEHGFQNSLKELNGDWITPEITQRAINLSQLIQQTVKENAFVVIKHRHLRDTANNIPEHHPLFREFKQLQPETIWPSKDRAFYYNYNPTYCGLEWLRIAIRMEKEGVDLCNTFTSFFAVAHLYNALKQDGLVESNWAVLDGAVESQLKHLFNDILPTTHKQIISRFIMKLGVPASAFAPNCRSASSAKNLGVNFVKGTENMLKTTEFSGALMSYLENPVAADTLLIQAQKHGRKNDDNKKAKARQGTPLEILTEMRIWLPQIIARVEIPYIKLTRQCSLLLLRIREALNEELGIDNKNGLVDCAEANPKENVLTVLQILGEAYGIELWSENARRNILDNTSIQLETPQLLIAARVTREFLVEIVKEEPIKAFDVPEALQLKRELNQKGQELQRRYMAGDQSAEVIDGLRRAFSEASI
ncbi:uncharacterized protein EAE98_008911 [Botrytis deweyae]|uniref:DUF6604 domain-containing protein n=1 Tax=Botrytis deweyae TaxID=2478750 RepID=A0ABQ7IDT6_9HELO|nr:uncharacterized protein EAE98_008911 [Botrytis deweyae]KAF7920882.1 hypothetical protein EAE98_008911 [Botrytis deweyae]